MSINKLKAFEGTLLTVLLSAWIQTVPAQTVPGGTLSPLTIPKYVTPLFIPPVLYDDGGAPMTVQVALRQINQQVLPHTFPSTPLWAYGDPANPATFNNPSFTIEATKGIATTVTWKNELVDAGGNFLPHIITDSAGTPVIDQTLLWAAPNQDCIGGSVRTDCRGTSGLPYTGPIPMVTHLHGAHVGPVSDGYPEAWWLPDANDIPAGFATYGKFYDDINGGAPGTGSATYQYTNDQPTSTLWYHDQSLGIARLNVYAAGGGFWMIRGEEDDESGLISGVLPNPAPKAGEDPNGNLLVRYAIREIPIAIQPKSFNLDGSQFYPADRAFFEGLGVGDTFADNTDLNIPFMPQPTTDIAPVWNPEAFFNTMVVNGRTWPILAVAPERYRFRILNAADSRFLNLSLQAIDVQFRGNASTKEKVLGEVPFYQIGAGQGLLPNVVRIETGFATTLPGDGDDVCVTGAGNEKPKGKGTPNKDCVSAVPGTFQEQALLIAPGERADVIVDFSHLPNGTDVVRMVNTAPDAPFGGFPDVPADPSTTGQVMQFYVSAVLSNPTGDPSTPAASLVLDNDPGGEAKLGPSSVAEDLALLEEESAVLCVTIDAVTGVITHDPNSLPPECDPVLGSLPFAPIMAVLGTGGSSGLSNIYARLWDDPIRQNPAVDDIQTWELWNHSADAHPIHLRPVKFEVINREVIGGAIRSAEPWEAGWKDTVIAYPGEVTRIKAKFDIPGLYLWHSNIQSDQDNEMKVPYCVGMAGIDCPNELF